MVTAGKNGARLTGVFLGILALVAIPACDAGDHEPAVDADPDPAGGKADDPGAEDDAASADPFDGAPYPRFSAPDLRESQPVRFASLSTPDENTVSLEIIEDGRDIFERREDGEVWTSNPFFTVTTSTDVRADPIREQVVLTDIDRPADGGCCGVTPGPLSVAVFDSSPDGGSWTQRTRRALVSDRVTASSLAVDQEGEPHVAFVRDTSDSTSTKTLNYADCTGAQECTLEAIAEFSDGAAAVGLVLGEDGQHQALVASDAGLGVYHRDADGSWAPDDVVESDLRIRRIEIEQGFGRSVAVVVGASGPNQHFAIFESADGTWDEVERVEYPWVLNSDSTNRSVEVRLTSTGLVVGTGACLEHEVRRDLMVCARAGWRLFREADAFAMEEIFVDEVRHPAAPVLQADGNPYHLGALFESVALYPAQGEVREPFYRYEAVDEGSVGLYGTLITDLRVRFPAEWSGEWTPDAVESRTRVDCDLSGDNPGFVGLTCVLEVTDPHRPNSSVREAFSSELDASMSMEVETELGHFVGHVERTTEGPEIVIDDFQLLITSPQSPSGGRERVKDFEPIRVPLSSWDE